MVDGCKVILQIEGPHGVVRFFDSFGVSYVLNPTGFPVMGHPALVAIPFAFALMVAAATICRVGPIVPFTI